MSKNGNMKKITFIGCDFKGSSTYNLLSKQKGWITFNEKTLLLWFTEIRKLAEYNNISVERLI